MRMTAPAIGGAAIGLALALVWWFRPQPEASLSDTAEVPTPAERVADDAPSIAAPDSSTDARAPVDVPITSPAARLERAPLPGETPVTPMAQLLADRQQNVIVRADPDTGGPPQELVEGEREFATEPIDSTWAPGAEAKLLATFAQRPGLKLIDLQVECRSTMCRVQLTQPTGTAAPGSPMPPLNILRDETGLTPRWVMAVVDRPGAPMSRSIVYLWREGFAPERGVGALQ